MSETVCFGNPAGVKSAKQAAGRAENQRAGPGRAGPEI